MSSCRYEVKRRGNEDVRRGEIKGNYHKNLAGKAWIVCI